MADAVMLFAAGFGTRMRPLTETRPKPLIEVAGKTLLDHALDQATAVPRKVINTHYLADQIAAHVRGRDDILLSHEAPDILETGGGLRHALPLLDADPVMTLNTDAVWGGPSPLDLLRAAWRPEMEALVLLLPLDRALGHASQGDFLRGDGGRLTRGRGEIYTGAHMTRTHGLADIPEQAFSLNRLWDAQIARGTLYGVLYPGTWCDVGQPESIALAEHMLNTHV